MIVLFYDTHEILTLDSKTYLCEICNRMYKDMLYNKMASRRVESPQSFCKVEPINCFIPDIVA